MKLFGTRIYILALITLVFQITVRADPQNEAETTTKRFAEALAQFDATNMVQELHPDVHQLCYQMAVHIAETTEPESEKKQFLKELGVKNFKELTNLSPKTVAVRFFQFGFSYASPQAREASLKSKITIVGSIVEGDLVHVLYRSHAEIKDLSMTVNVPSLVTLKRYNGKLKVLSTTQFESMKAQLRTQDVPK